MRSVILVASLSLAAVGCVSQDSEVQLGQKEAKQINAQIPLVDDRVVTDYVNALGTSIAKTTTRADLDWHFAVVNSDVVNAFALPGGYVYVDRGVLARASNESEVASVLGHEIEHVVRRHYVSQLEKQEGAQLGVALACRLTRICSSALGQAAIQVGGAAAFAKFSRADEIQADEGGFQNVINAGIDPRGMLTFFEKLLNEQQQGGDALILPWFSDHPGTEDRVADVKRMIAAQPPGSLDELRADSPAFHTMKTALDRLPPAPRPAPPDSSPPR